MKAIGKVSASEKYPTTVDEFCFWLEDDVIVRPFDIVKAKHYKDSVTYGIIEEITHITDGAGHISSYVSSDFGDVSSEPETRRLRLTFVKCRVLSNHSNEGFEQIYMPIRDGQVVYYCDEDEVVEALGLKDIRNPVPAGFIEMSNNITVPINLNSDFLIGPEGAHLNISGISGLATKTSYAMFVLQALQQKKQDDIAIIILNVKSSDLLRLDECNPDLTDLQKESYIRAGLECKPFENVKYFYPYVKKEERYFSNTYLQTNVLSIQHNKDCAFNYIYTYEDDSDQLDLLFSNIDDPAQTMESILTYIAENPDFQGLNWDSFLQELKEYTRKGSVKDRDITIQSWRKFRRLIRKSIGNDIFQSNKGSQEKRQVNLRKEVENIGQNQVFVIDISKLGEQLQGFVFGNVLRAVYALKLGETERDEEDIPKHIVIFVDELNKYASSSTPRNSPILNNILEIAERGRSLGIVLFSAEQFKSAIHDRAKGNCSTHAYGRTNAIEISKPDYRFIPKVFTNMMTRLSKGDLIIEHPIFRTLLRVKWTPLSRPKDELVL